MKAWETCCPVRFQLQLNNIQNVTTAEVGCKSIMRQCDYVNTVYTVLSTMTSL